MRIVNIMFAKGAGGIEQAFVDYCEGLRDRGHQVTAMVYPGSVVHSQLIAMGIHTVVMRNFSQWDIFAVNRLRKHLEVIAPDIVIAHGNRAYSLARKAIKNQVPLVGVAQNYSTRRLKNAEAVMTTTADLIVHIAKQGVSRERIFHIPNMMKCTELPHRAERNDPPIIGAVGRFVAKKGFDVYIDALKQLKARGLRFRAVLGGDGAEADSLKQRATAAGLDDILYFPGWVADKKQFYTGIDIFCLPSLHEPFGIVLLEAFTFGAPVVSTDSEGPSEIISAGHDALMVKKADSRALADALAQLLEEEHLADMLAANAYVKVKTQYSLEVVAEKIEKACEEIISRRAEKANLKKKAA